MDSSSSVKIVSKCFVKPKTIPEESKQPYYLSPWDYAMLSVQYIQKGLLFHKPSLDSIDTLLEKLRESLAVTLVHFYPLAGRLSSLTTENPKSYSVFVDCNDSPGAGFIYATSDLCVADIVGAKYVPSIVHSFFDHHRVVNHDGHTLSLLSVQNWTVYEPCDGRRYCLLEVFTAWSEIFQGQESNKNDDLCLKNPPVLKRYIPEGYGPLFSLPYSHADEFIRTYESPVLKERMFCFSSETIRLLKAKVNQICGTTSISSFQSLTAVIWRCITRARRLPLDRETSCRIAADNRGRMYPPLHKEYFGNCLSSLRTAAKAGELMENDLGFAALKVHQAVAEHTSEKVSQMIDQWLKSPFIYHIDRLFEPMSVVMGSSPRFNKYGCEFGMGKGVTLRSGYAHKFDGKVSAYPGREGGGSIDLEVCLVPEFMEALELDEEFMSLVSL
ncbi:transferase family protein [Arabidopsis lyrata subsp. lyrata]|uniref:Transferase family protein n=1 Tax=Arabidopsis lyrata subsp. lyrata TaxID=81972 RepID=D7MQU2_ARALL|nr:transferase family protein [Arabidopsis lyrata subsp. lyrata]